MSNSIRNDQQTERRHLYLREALSYVPKLVELADRDRMSSTYGCFDRAFWHYRTADFPSGMYQEAVLPLALACTIEHPENPYFGNDSLRDLAIAGIRYAGKSAHANGSCDDYFPFERASGATAFALYACTEACLLLNLNDEDILTSLGKRAEFLLEEGYFESGVLSNHKALIALAVYNAGIVTKNNRLQEGAKKLLLDLLSLQTEEGWFPEYGGCDPGYLTFTIDFLAKYYKKAKDNSLIEPLRKAIACASYFVHPDFSYGGEYGSRNTFHLMPHGLEIMSAEVSEAGAMADAFLESCLQGKRSRIDDDRIFIHYVYNYFQAFQEIGTRGERHSLPCFSQVFMEFPKAGLLAAGDGSTYAVISLRKGGVAKIFKDGALVYSDCGIAGKTKEGQRFTSQNPYCSHELDSRTKELRIEGWFSDFEENKMSPFKFLLFRIFLLTFARFMPPNMTRSIIQKIAITRKPEKVPLKYVRVYDLQSFSAVKHSLELVDRGMHISYLWISSDSTYMYVATSQPYQPGNLHSWINLDSEAEKLRLNGKTEFEIKL